MPARTIARSVDVILLDPREETNDLPNAVEVGVAAFRTMQRKILESEFQQAYFTSFAIQELRRIAPDALARVATDSPVLGTFLERIPVTEFAYMRPESTLPVGVGGFDDQENIGKTFDLGVADAEKPFTPYDWATFEY